MRREYLTNLLGNSISRPSGDPDGLALSTPAGGAKSKEKRPIYEETLSCG
jgi:hypothetical protein